MSEILCNSFVLSAADPSTEYCHLEKRELPISDIRVCFLLDTSKNSEGGATRMLVWLANSMAEHGMSVAFLDMTNNEYAQDHIKKECLYRSVGLPDRSSSKRKMRDLPNAMRSLISFFREFKPHTVVNFGDHGFYYLLMLRRVCGFKLLVSERADPFSSRSAGERVRRLLYNRADVAVFQTEQAATFYSKRLRKSSRVIPNPVKSRFEDEWRQKRSRVIISMGRLDFTQKRLDVLLEAMTMVPEDIALEVYGFGSVGSVERIASLAVEFGLANRVKYMGSVSDPRDAFSRGDLFVLSSDFEGIPNSLIEALDYGIPVVSTDCSPGGADLLLEGGKWGFLVERSNPEELAKAICMRYSISEGELDKMRIGGRDSLRRFDESAVANAWRLMLRSVSERLSA